MKRWTIRTLLTLWYTGSVGAISAVSLVLLYWGFAYTSYRSVDLLLEEEAEALGTYVSLSPQGDVRTYIAQLIAEKDFGGGNKYVQICNDRGDVVERSANLGAASLPLPLQEGVGIQGEAIFATIALPDVVSVRTITLPVIASSGRNFFIQEGVSLESTYTSLRRLRTLLFFLAPGILGLSLVSGRLMARQVLRPIETITQQARVIEAQDLSQRLLAANPRDEIGRLIAVLNSLLSRLETSFIQMRQFIAHAAHELRTPLAVLRCGMEVTVSRARAPDEYQEALGTSIEHVSQLSRIVENLFLLARADAGSQEFDWQEVDLSGLLQEVYEQAELMAEAKGLTASLHTDGKVAIRGDRLRLKQLLLNLLDNAIKYTPIGGRLRLAAHREEGWAKVMVEDNGIGIPEETLPRIFDRFYRVEKARSLDDTGGGLGLSICQWIVQAHGGKITVQSRSGQGSTFLVSLPVAQAS